MKYDTPEFYRYPMAPGFGTSFMTSFDQAQKDAMEKAAMKEKIAASQQTREQAAQKFPMEIEQMQMNIDQAKEQFPLEMEKLKTNIEKIRDDMSLTPYQKQLMSAQAAHDFALATKEKEETKHIPEKMSIEAQNAATRAIQAKFQSAPSTALMRSLNTPEMQSLVQSNPEVAKAVSTALYNTALQAGGQAVQEMGNNQTGKQYISDSIQTNGKLPISDPLVKQNITQGINNGTITDTDIKTMQQNTGDALSRKTITAQIMNQRQYAGILDNLFVTGEELMPSVAKYAGAAGKGAKTIDAVKSSLGTTTKDYANYLNFTRYVAPVTANEIRRALAGQATDSENEMMLKLANPTYWDSNPEMAMKQWTFLTNMYRYRIDPALAARPTETLSKLKSSDFAPPGTNLAATKQEPAKQQFTNDDVARLMKQYPNKSKEEITNALRKKYGG